MKVTLVRVLMGREGDFLEEGLLTTLAALLLALLPVSDSQSELSSTSSEIVQI